MAFPLTLVCIILGVSSLAAVSVTSLINFPDTPQAIPRDQTACVVLELHAYNNTGSTGCQIQIATEDITSGCTIRLEPKFVFCFFVIQNTTLYLRGPWQEDQLLGYTCDAGSALGRSRKREGTLNKHNEP